jgi:hypothetical protein
MLHQRQRMRIVRVEERMLNSLRYVFFDLLCLRLSSFLLCELLLLSLLSLFGSHDNVLESDQVDGKRGHTFRYRSRALKDTIT